MSYQTLGKDRDRHSGETVNIDTRERPEGGNMYKLDLHMFDGGAAAGGAPAAGSTAQAGGTATQAGGTAVQTEGTQSGEQEGEQSNQLTPEEQRKADYKKFKEQYKDLYGEDVKKQVDRRFAPMNRMQQQLDSQGRLMQVIAAKYGTDASDVDGMINAINADFILILIFDSKLRTMKTSQRCWEPDVM